MVLVANGDAGDQRPMVPGFFYSLFLVFEPWSVCASRTSENPGGRGGEKSGIKHQSLAIRYDLSVLLALNFKRDELLCVFFGYTMVRSSQRRIFSLVDLV